jgi:hypothetical protein
MLEICVIVVFSPSRVHALHAALSAFSRVPGAILNAGILQDRHPRRVVPVAFTDAPALAQLVQANEAHLRHFLPMVAGLHSCSEPIAI